MKLPLLLTSLAFFLTACGGSGGGKRTVDTSSYSHRMHNRFYQAWVPPANISSTRAKISVPVDVEIDARGRVLSFAIARSSGNTAVDDSINAVASRVRKVARPPGASANQPFKLRIFFELDVR